MSKKHNLDVVWNVKNSIKMNGERVETETLETSDAPQKVLTPSEYKKAMRQFFTVQHGTVKACGHSYDPNNYPRNRNCEACWWAFFQNHGELVTSFDELFQKHGKQALERMQGKKVTEMFYRFMSTLANMKKEVEAAKIASDPKVIDSVNKAMEDIKAGRVTQLDQLEERVEEFNGNKNQAAGRQEPKIQATSGSGESTQQAV